MDAAGAEEDVAQEAQAGDATTVFNVIEMMAASLQSGYSVENAVRASAKELEKLYPRDTFIVLEFQNMALQLDRNQSVESLLQDLAGAKSGGGPAKLCRGVSDSKAHGWRSAACDPQYGFVYQAEAGDGCRD